MIRRIPGLRWMCAATLALVAGCSGAEKQSENQTSMRMSSGRYNQGYKDGMRDAKVSLFDDHAGWMWLWMLEKEYQDGYKRGWSDGRGMARLEAQRKDTEKHEPKQRQEQEE